MAKKDSLSKNLIIIDAADRPLGRVATEVAVTLRGKHLAAFLPNQVANIKVKVINISKARLSGNKAETKKYYRFSGYPGGLKQSTLGQEFNRHPLKLFRSIVEHMLPKNKLRRQWLRNLIISK